VSDLKTRFLSHLSHELRTPLNAIRNLTRLLLDGYEGPLAAGQRRGVELIQASAEGLVELVDELLDIARIEAGQVVVRPETFTVAELFAGLRGVFRSLHANDRVGLVFEDAAALPPLTTDQAKVAQILRNFVGNALKFTEHGEVRVRAELGDDDVVHLAVRDTGIGIAPEDQERIFEEWAQVEHPLQRRARGSGLGLSLSRRLARALGGDITVRSAPGIGSTFTLAVPRRHDSTAGPDGAAASGSSGALAAAAAPEGDRA
jgi:signal transduction histidine kinase